MSTINYHIILKCLASVPITLFSMILAAALLGLTLRQVNTIIKELGRGYAF